MQITTFDNVRQCEVKYKLSTCLTMIDNGIKIIGTVLSTLNHKSKGEG